MREESVDPAAQEGANDSDDDVAQNSAEAGSRDDPFRDDADDQAENDPSSNSHFCNLPLTASFFP